MLFAIGLDVSAALTNLGNERKDLDQQLKTATQELLGQPNDDAKAVTLLVSKGFKEELAPLPKATAFDLLDQISRKVPSDDKIKLDIMELDIRPKKTFIKGTVDSAAAVDEIASQAQGDRLLRGREQGGDHRGVGRRQAVHPQHQLEMSVSGGKSS